jgi:hypothetical protein
VAHGLQGANIEACEHYHQYSGRLIVIAGNKAAVREFHICFNIEGWFKRSEMHHKVQSAHIFYIKKQ